MTITFEVVANGSDLTYYYSSLSNGIKLTEGCVMKRIHRIIYLNSRNSQLLKFTLSLYLEPIQNFECNKKLYIIFKRNALHCRKTVMSKTFMDQH